MAEKDKPAPAVLRFFQADWRRKWLWVEASWYLAIATFLVKVVPFKHWRGLLGTPAKANETANTFPRARKLDTDMPSRIGYAVIGAAAHLPWKPVCLPQAMAGLMMLRKRGFATDVYFGSRLAQTSDKPIDLHAWLVTNDICITGFDTMRTFVALSVFHRAAKSAQADATDKAKGGAKL